MDAANGVGLAANQIGVSQRVFVYDCADERGRTDPSPRRGGQPGAGDLRGARDHARSRQRRRGLSVGARRVVPDGPGRLGAGHGPRRRRHARSRSRATACSRGCCSTRPDTSTGSSTSTADRQACARGQAQRQVPRLGRAGVDLDARRGSRSRSATEPAMPDLPPVGTRVSLRYRLPAGSVPPLTDVVGHLLEVGPDAAGPHQARRRGRRRRRRRGRDQGAAAAPVRTGDIRNLEHAAALAWPGVEQQWIDGWLLRYGHGSTRRANSAVPLEVRGDLSATARDRRLVRGPRRAAAARPPPTGCSGCHRVCRRDGENVVMATRPGRSHRPRRRFDGDDGGPARRGSGCAHTIRATFPSTC